MTLSTFDPRLPPSNALATRPSTPPHPDRSINTQPRTVSPARPPARDPTRISAP